MNKSLISYGVVFASVSVYNGYKKLDAKCAPKSKVYSFGEEIQNSDSSVKQVVVGYFGASSEFFKNGRIDSKRGLYYTHKKGAQLYAKGRAKGLEKPMVGIVVANRRPKPSDHAMGRFEGFDPLSEKFIEEENVKIIHLEEVTSSTCLGFMANLRRYLGVGGDS